MPDYELAPAADYGRVSTDDQQNSLDMQDKKIRDYAAFKGLTLREDLRFRDADVSGTVSIAERPGGKLLMELLRSGKVKHLIVGKLDRLGRNAVDIQTTWHHLTRELGVTIHVIDLGGDSVASDSPITRFIVGMLSLFAELEVESIRIRIKDVLHNKFLNGEQTSTLPYGSSAKPTGRFTTKRRENVEIMAIIPNPEEQKWLVQMVLWRCAEWSYRRIAKELNAANVPTKTGKRWQPGTVHAVLNNKFTRPIVQSTADQFEVSRNATG